MKHNFSVQLYSVHKHFHSEPLITLRQLKQMGYSGVESFGHFALSSADFKSYLSDLGLEITGYHTGWDMVQDDKIDSTIKYFKEIGNKYVIIPGLPNECTASIAAWKKTAEKFNELSARLGGEGMTIGYHNHFDEFKPLDGEIPITVFFDSTDPSVVFQMDNGNALHGNADIMAVLKRYPGRAKTVHLKPYSKTAGFSPVIGKDDINWTDFFSWCDSSGGTEHYIVEYEDEKTHPQMVGVDLCLKGLRELEAAGKI